ncbi:MAG: LLM class flavin-dependent oxidoreductase [Candidatus Tectomicrobia bacterium]|nr:LLM class flavin-dependent oxidoreductase [Candidatus Tectomicrobia bacterium]
MSADRVHLGINVNNRVPVIFPQDYPPPRMLELAERAEALGYDYVFAGDNFFGTARYESLTTLAAIAARTRRVKLGTAILIATLRHTVWLALHWATIDQLSEGRTILNMAVGAASPEYEGGENEKEFAVAGVEKKTRGALLEEQVAVLRGLWTQERFTYHGKFHHLDAVPAGLRPRQVPCPPIWLANNPQIYAVGSKLRERMLRRVGRLADGWMTCTATQEEYRELWQAVRAYAAEYGRDPEALEPAYQMTVNVNPDRRQARAEALEYLNAYYVSSLKDLSDSFWRRDPFGSPQEIIDRVGGLVEAGCRHFIVRFASRHQFQQLDLFTQHVFERVRGMR